LEHFKKLQRNLEFHQNKCHPGNVPDMMRPCARPLTSGPRGWSTGQTPCLAGPTLQPLAGQLHGDTVQEAVIGNSKPKVGGGQTLWPPGHVARPIGHHLASYRLNQVGNPFLDPYKYPSTGGNQYTTLYL
jgi:hypothetical protein